MTERMDMITTILHDSPIFQGGLALMITGWIGYTLRSIPSRIFQLTRGACTRVIEVREHHPLYDAWLGLVTESAMRPGGPRTLEVRAIANEEYDQRAANSIFAAGHDRFWARIENRLCRVIIMREDAAGRHDLMRKNMIRVEIIGGSRGDMLRMMREAKRRANVFEDRQVVDLCDKYGSRSTMNLPRRCPTTLCLPDGFFESIEERVTRFLSSRDEYERVGVPWRYGIMLHGKPGTGKTTIAHTLASRIGHRLAVIPLADLRSDEELVSSFDAVRDQSIVLIEDVDCAFKQRENAEAEGISFSGFLNCIDGVLAPHNGRILIMSTNHIDKLDPALIRPGRIDARIEVPLLDRNAAIGYVDRLFSHIADRHEIVEEVISTDTPTGAVLINRIMQEEWRRTQSRSDDEVCTREMVTVRTDREVANRVQDRRWR